MLQERYTSFALSRDLHEAGCRIPTKNVWVMEDPGALVLPGPTWKIEPFDEIATWKDGTYSDFYFAYDLICDICLRNSKEFFGPKNIILPSRFAVSVLITMLKKGDNQSAENYIREHSIFFKK